MDRDALEIVASVTVCIGLLIANPFVTNDIPRFTQNQIKNNFVLQLIVALAMSYSITRSFRDSFIALIVFLILKRCLRAYSKRSRSPS